MFRLEVHLDSFGSRSLSSRPSKSRQLLRRSCWRFWRRHQGKCTVICPCEKVKAFYGFWATLFSDSFRVWFSRFSPAKNNNACKIIWPTRQEHSPSICLQFPKKCFKEFSSNYDLELYLKTWPTWEHGMISNVPPHCQTRNDISRFSPPQMSMPSS